MTWGNPETTGEHLLSALLQPASALYGLGAYLRLVAYGAGCLKRHQAPVPVLSVGNLTCGGSGKTPVVIDLARRLAAGRRKVAVLSRGYRRRSTEELLIVSDGAGSLAGCQDAGDEPYMVAAAVPEAVVIVCARRALAAEVAVKVYDADVILLDDGFQHLALMRDQDLVLIDYSDDLDADRLLPAGRLREPPSALARAGWVAVTRVPPDPDPARLSRLTERVAVLSPRAKLTSCRFVPSRLSSVSGRATEGDPGALRSAKVVALCGIARPASFFQLLEHLGAQIVRTRAYADHHWWSHKDLETVRADLRDTGAQLVVTTEKDAVRLPPDLAADLPVYSLGLETEWLGPVPVLGEPPFDGPGCPAVQAGGQPEVVAR